MTTYQYVSLTAAIKDKASPLRRYFDTRFPNTRPLQLDYKERAGELLVEPGSAAPGTLGTAFDLQLRYLLDLDYIPHIARRGFNERSELRSVVSELLLYAITVRRSFNAEALNRACWALALCVEVFRARGVRPGSPLRALIDEGRFTLPDLLALAPDDALRQLDELRQLAKDHLYSRLGVRLHLGPTFEGSQLCAADADLISDGLLIEIKTHVGSMGTSTGLRSDSLSVEDLYQVLGYALFDRPDRFHIDSIGIYSARYGNMTVWPMADALERLAGERVDLRAERETVWQLLGGK